MKQSTKNGLSAGLGAFVVSITRDPFIGILICLPILLIVSQLGKKLRNREE